MKTLWIASERTDRDRQSIPDRDPGSPGAGKPGNAWLLGAILVLVAPDPSSGASLSVEPEITYLGSFSTFDPLSSDILTGTTTIQIQSETDWHFLIQLERPITRVGDGLELPIDRVWETYPDVPGEVVDFRPYVAESGSGSSEVSEIVGNWRDLGAWLQPLLRPGDPPGRYEMVASGWLVAEDGRPLTEAVPAILEFDIAPWTQILDPVPDFELSLYGGELEGGSEAVYLTVASNTSWELYVSGTEELVRTGGGHVLGLDCLEICAGAEGGTVMHGNPDCIALSSEATLLAAGPAPPPFTTNLEEIPIYIVFTTEPPLPAGDYVGAFEFTAVSGVPLP